MRARGHRLSRRHVGERSPQKVAATRGLRCRRSTWRPRTRARRSSGSRSSGREAAGRFVHPFDDPLVQAGRAPSASRSWRIAPSRGRRRPGRRRRPGLRDRRGGGEPGRTSRSIAVEPEGRRAAATGSSRGAGHVRAGVDRRRAERPLRGTAMRSQICAEHRDRVHVTRHGGRRSEAASASSTSARSSRSSPRLRSASRLSWPAKSLQERAVAIALSSRRERSRPNGRCYPGFR